MYICVDFDGTIVDHRFPKIGPPVPGALEWLHNFQKNNIKIILFTMRSDGQIHGDVLTQACNYLSDNGIVLYGVNHNPDQDTWTTSPKAYGHLYIDDAAVGCPMIHPKGFMRPCVNWEEIARIVCKLLY